MRGGKTSQGRIYAGWGESPRCGVRIGCCSRGRLCVVCACGWGACGMNVCVFRPGCINAEGPRDQLPLASPAYPPLLISSLPQSVYALGQSLPCFTILACLNFLLAEAAVLGCTVRPMRGACFQQVSETVRAQG